MTLQQVLGNKIGDVHPPGAAIVVSAVAVLVVCCDSSLILSTSSTYVLHDAQSHLLLVALATGLTCILSGLGENGEENRCKDEDYSYDDKQLCESEGSITATLAFGA